ncbi:MAG: 4-(cytidine 5'-diphospho)-2-C-methyl-D-erythritol kinase [Rhizobiaceae bacterium]|nr:4-(cytidine 5'-diphospho)-2-C-methyl-D-erythritol kinase [Rhizobiaceae bacterium]
MPDSVTRLAPAKLNLALHVTAKRTDGYHDIDSLVAFADFGDRVTVSPAEADAFIVTGHYAPMVPIDEGNLVLAARDLLRAQAGAERASPACITLEKNLPVASGVGGGSSDAAATLRALKALWDVEADLDRLAVAALPLGADIPMCLAGRPLHARGVGNVINPLEAFPDVDAVLVNPGLPVSTPAVFGALEKRDNAPLPCPHDFADAAALVRYLDATRNDLQHAAVSLCPMIADTLDALAANGAMLARMSGSGATCFGLFDGVGFATAAADAIRRAQPGWFVEACRIRGTKEANDGGN